MAKSFKRPVSCYLHPPVREYSFVMKNDFFFFNIEVKRSALLMASSQSALYGDDKTQINNKMKCHFSISISKVKFYHATTCVTAVYNFITGDCVSE